MGRQRVGDNVRSCYIIELYQLVVNEILDTVSQVVTFFKGMPFGLKMVFTFLGWIKAEWEMTFSGPCKHRGY